MSGLRRGNTCILLVSALMLACAMGIYGIDSAWAQETGFEDQKHADVALSEKQPADGEPLDVDEDAGCEKDSQPAGAQDADEVVDPEAGSEGSTQDKETSTNEQESLGANDVAHIDNGDSPTAISPEPLLSSSATTYADPVPVASGPQIVTTQVLDDNGVYQIICSESGKLLDVSGGSSSNGANIQQYQSNNTLAQFFKALWQNNGWYTFINLKSGLALDVSGAGSANGTNVAQYTSNGTDAQLWALVKHEDGSFSLIPRCALNSCLDISSASHSDGANAQIWASNGTAAQRFSFVKQEHLTQAVNSAEAAPAGSNVFYIVSDASGKVIDISAGSTSNGANVQAYSQNNTLAQKFSFMLACNGLYYIASPWGAVLDVSAGSVNDGANVQMHQSNGTLAQLWYFVSAGDGSFVILSANSGKALDIKDGNLNNGANIQQFQANGTQAQSFHFVTGQLVENGYYVLQSAIVGPMVLDIAAGSLDNGANAQTYRSNGTAAQVFYIKFLDDGSYSIMNHQSGKFLDVSGGALGNGANIQQYQWNGTDAQKWIIQYSQGGYTFCSVVSNKYLDVAGGSRFRGANVQQYAFNGSAAQRFILQAGDWSFYGDLSGSRMEMITVAEQYEGWDYVWGGRSPSVGFDCAGLVEYCANTVYGAGIDVMYTNAESLAYNHCYFISASEAQPGDLVFYRGTYGSNVDYISHVVLYCGNGIMYGAGDPIGYQSVYAITNIYGNTAEPIYARLYCA